jgi:serine/threonine-protein kinase
MFLNEAQVVGALDHPNILRIYDAGNFKGRPYIAMEYVDGYILKNYINFH